MIYNPPPTSQFLTTAAMSNHSHGDPALFLTNLTGTTASNSAGFTLSLSAGAGGPGGGGAAISAGANSQSTGTVHFSEGGGVTFGLSNNGVMTATVKTDYLTTAALSNHSHGNPTLALTNLNGTTASASNGFTLSLSAFATTAALSNHSHGNPTLALTNINGTTASASNGLTLSLSVAAQSVQSQNVVALHVHGANGTATFTSGTVAVHAGNNATLSTGANAFSVHVPAGGTGGGGATISTYHNHPINILTTMSGPSNVSASFQFLPIREAVTATRLELPVSVSVATNTNNSSAAILYTLSAYLYTKNGETLQSVSSGSGAGTHTWSSNVTGSMTGGRFVSAAINVNATPGNYFVGLHLSTRATGHAGPASTSLGNTMSMLGVGTAMAGAITFGAFNAATAASAGWYTVGMNSSTGNLTQVSLSNVTQAGSGFQRANVALRMYL